MTDPYKVLGVSRDATDEQIKKAYRNLARKYHPDNYVNNPLADLVEEKMKEINEAYDRIQKERSGASASATHGANTITLSQIRTLINQGRYQEAGTYLDYFAPADRGAEWNFLKGCVLAKRGYYYDAQKFYETACYLDPENEEYRDAYNKFKNIKSTRETSYTSSESSSGCSVCDVCAGLMCADCCCECMGGDLIRCC